MSGKYGIMRHAPIVPRYDAGTPLPPRVLASETPQAVETKAVEDGLSLIRSLIDDNERSESAKAFARACDSHAPAAMPLNVGPRPLGWATKDTLSPSAEECHHAFMQKVREETQLVPSSEFFELLGAFDRR